MDGCLPDPDKKYPLRSDGPANFAFSATEPEFCTCSGNSHSIGYWYLLHPKGYPSFLLALPQTGMLVECLTRASS